MVNTQFVLSPKVTRSFDKKTHKKFLAQYRLCAEFTRSGKEFHEFVGEYINKGEIKVSELEKFFNDELLYGNQRAIYMYNLRGDLGDKQNQQVLLKNIQAQYPYVDSLKYHKILFQPFNKEITNLVSVRIYVGYDAKIIQKIVLIFSEECSISLKNGRHKEYSYITVDVDFTSRALYIRTEPKSSVIEEDKKPSKLVEKYFGVVKKIIGLHIIPFNGEHKETLCSINTELYNQIYSKIVQEKPTDISEYVSAVTNNFWLKFKIDNYKEKMAQSNIFNVSDILTKMIEHILITDVIYGTAATGVLDGVEGYVTYIKFSDGTNISARVRGETLIEPIYSSEAFMALRASIDNAKKISVLKLSWLNDYHGTRVSYDATDNSCLKILLYKSYTKEEFEYAVRKYRESEQKTIRGNTAVFTVERAG